MSSKITISPPGVYIQEIPTTKTIRGASTSITAFVGLTKKGPLNKATKINQLSQFEDTFGDISGQQNLGYAVRHYFQNGGIEAIIVSVGNSDSVNSDKIIGLKKNHTGIYSLDEADSFNILCITPYDKTDTVDIAVYQKALEYCKLRRAILLVDPPKKWMKLKDITNDLRNFSRDENAAIYFPRVKIREKTDFVPCGIIAGIIAKTDYAVGVWKAPAGIDASIFGIEDFMLHLNDAEIGTLNAEAVNCLKKIPRIGFVVWGARTMKGANAFASEWKYLPVRRTALFIEESLYRGLNWTVFEPNDEPLWASIRASVDSFLGDLFREGAFLGSSAHEAYYIKCGRNTTTQTDIDRGIVNLTIGFAPLMPAEFIMISLQLSAMKTSTKKS